MLGAGMASTLGRYRLIERIAVGGMGEVHRGVDVGWGGVERPVAVKVIAPDLARHADFVQTFIDEARLSYQLNHTNLVHVRDIGETDDTWFIAMEWVDGADLGTVLKHMRQPLPARFATLIALEAARGLDYAHRLRGPDGAPLKLVHRDVSPTNLLISFEGEVKVTDFGIARWRMRQAVSLPGSLKGKMGYMAPEQARGEEVDARADVFALGVVLYEMVTGKNPYLDGGATEAEVLMRVQAGRLAPPSAHHALPQGLEAIVLRATAAERDQRYATCALLAEDLEACARREGWSLSPAQLGAFVHDLLGAPTTGPYRVQAETARQSPVARRTPTTSVRPRPFDDALGAQLAVLSGVPQLDADSMEMPALEVAAPEGPGPAAGTVAMHKVVRAPSTIELEAMVRRRRGPLLWACVLVAGVLAAAVALRGRLHLPVAAPAPLAARAPAPAPARAPAPAPAPAHEPARAPVSVPAARPSVHHARPVLKPGSVSVRTDVEAQIWIDNKLVGESPVEDLALLPGRHTLRAVGHAAGLRLLPKEETFVLHDGEKLARTMELK